MRVFVVCADINGSWSLELGLLTAADISKKARTGAYSLNPPSGIKIQILSVVYGREQITNDEVYADLYRRANLSQPVPVHNDHFHKDTSPDVVRSTAIYCTVNGGEVKSISGREWEGRMPWSF